MQQRQRERYWIPGTEDKPNFEGCLTYARRQFFIPPIKNETCLPYNHKKLNRFRTWEVKTAASLEYLPLEILQRIFSILLNDVKDLEALASVSTRLLSAIMQAVQMPLSMRRNRSIEWHPYRQTILEGGQDFYRKVRKTCSISDYDKYRITRKPHEGFSYPVDSWSVIIDDSMDRRDLGDVPEKILEFYAIQWHRINEQTIRRYQKQLEVKSTVNYMPDDMDGLTCLWLGGIWCMLYIALAVIIAGFTTVFEIFAKNPDCEPLLSLSNNTEVTAQKYPDCTSDKSYLDAMNSAFDQNFWAMFGIVLTAPCVLFLMCHCLPKKVRGCYTQSLADKLEKSRYRHALPTSLLLINRDDIHDIHDILSEDDGHIIIDIDNNDVNDNEVNESTPLLTSSRR